MEKEIKGEKGLWELSNTDEREDEEESIIILEM